MADPLSQIEAAHRRARAVELRRQRVPFADIGAEFGVSAQRAYQIYREALKEIPAEHVEEHRDEEVDLCNEATSSLRLLADNEDISPRTRIEAWSAMRGWSEHKSRMLGLNAPKKIEASVTEPEADDPEIVALVRAAKERAAEKRRQLEQP
jgi:hypothetical protein